MSIARRSHVSPLQPRPTGTHAHPRPARGIRVSLGLLQAVLVILVLLAGCTQGAPTLEQRAQGLDSQIMCPICPSETIDQSQTQIAADMRATVREQLAAGRSEAQIKQYFVARYGDGILARPPARGVNLMVWVVPPVAVALGAVVVLAVVRAMARGRPNGMAPAEQVVAESDLTVYLAQVDALTDETQSRPSAAPGERDRPATEGGDP